MQNKFKISSYYLTVIASIM